MKVNWEMKWLGMCLACLLGPGWLTAQRAVSLDMTTTFALEGPTQLIKYTLLLPQDIDGRQRILRLKFDPEPHRMYKKHGNQYAEFRLVRPKEAIEVRMEIDALVWEYSYELARQFPHHVKAEPLEEYVKADRLYQPKASAIQGLVIHLPAENPLAQLQAIYQQVQDTLTYQPNLKEELGPVQALEQGQGDCTEFTDLFVSLCRATGIPSRGVSGWMLTPTLENPNHHWAEVWLEGLGWIPVDPSQDIFRRTKLGPFQADSRQHYLYLSRNRWDPVCKSSNNRWVASGKVSASYRYEWRNRME
ncbi:MAG: transglutaminase family protein [Bacteroidota bacterium]